jgi:hypothetical protein
MSKFTIIDKYDRIDITQKKDFIYITKSDQQQKK